jgi:2-polyprenyl-3-methyl-5-hydroxy-6-metoxy-1,4-benzoquinol methylase/uncharacterized protein YbaR (Trm112 family)
MENALKELKEKLCCPKCKSDIYFEKDEWNCSKCGTKFSVSDGIPIMVSLDDLDEHLRKQIEYFGKEDIIKNEKFSLEAWQKNYINKFVSNFQDVKGKTVLDCGAGSGYMSIELAKMGAKVFSCDLTFKGIKRLKKISENLNLNINAICCSAEELPFKNKSFDYFICNAVLEHLPRERETIGEIERVCKDFAGIMISVPLSYRFLHPLLLPINFIHDKKIGHLRRYNEESILKKFRKYNKVSVYYTGHIKKVFKVLINMIWPVFNLEKIESSDDKKNRQRKWSSNIMIFLRNDSN